MLTVDFELDGQPFTAINGGPEFKFDEAVSFLIDCADQKEIDYYWDKLTDGGEEGPCGWVKDKYGLSWQVAPSDMDDMLTDPKDQRGQRAMKAMLKMKKIDIAALHAAADNALVEPVSAEVGPASLLASAHPGFAQLAMLGERPLAPPAVVVGAGQLRVGSGRARRRRAVQKSVRASSPRVVTAASMRALNRRVDSPSIGGSGEPNTTLVLPGLGRFMPLP